MTGISGPLLDRIDYKRSDHIEVPRVEYEKLSDQRLGEPSECVRDRVEAARQTQRERFSTGEQKPVAVSSTVTCNADMRVAEIRNYCLLDETSRSLMKTAMSVHAKHAMQLSARAYHRILKLARTIADLAGSEQIGPSHLAEALQYRPRNMFS